MNAMAKTTSKKSVQVAKKAAAKQSDAKPILLAGGNPQIAKGDGDVPVQAYIAAMPEKRRRAPPRRAHRAHGPRRAQGGQMELAALRSRGPRLVPRHPLLHEVRQGGFFRGTWLRPVPPGESKSKDTRYLDIHEDRPARRSAVRRLGEASEPIAGREAMRGWRAIRLGESLSLEWRRATAGGRALLAWSPH